MLDSIEQARARIEARIAARKAAGLPEPRYEKPAGERIIPRTPRPDDKPGPTSSSSRASGKPGPPVAFEKWLITKLGAPCLFDGTTTALERLSLARYEIRRQGIQQATAGSRNGLRETWAQLFERMYGEPLEPVARDPITEPGSGNDAPRN